MSLMMMVVVRLFSTIHSTVTTIQLHRKKVWQQTFFEIQALWFAAWQHQQQISTNEDNLQRQQEDEKTESYHLVNDCLDDVQIYAPPPFCFCWITKILGRTQPDYCWFHRYNWKIWILTKFNFTKSSIY
jgi:hypothetical protein